MPLKSKIFFTANPSTDRERKNLLFLNLIRKKKSTSRTELSKETNINIVTVSNYINGYLKNGLVLERGYDISSGGRRPELVELNKEWGYVIGVDAAENYIKGIVTNLNMDILADESIHGYEKSDLKLCICELLKKIFEHAKVDKSRVKKIALAISRISGDFAKEATGLGDSIGSEIKIPVLIAGDALCAAFGEKNINPEAAEAPSLLYIYKDTGEGIFIKDDAFCEAGNDKYAYLKPWGRGLSLANEAGKIVARGVGTKIVSAVKANAKNITMTTVIKAAEEQDEAAIDLVRMAGMNMGVRIAYLVNLLETENVIVGGGIEKAGNNFLNPLKSSVYKFVLQNILDKVKIKAACLGEEARAKGAASLAIREAFIEA